MTKRVVVTTAPNQTIAEMWRDALAEHGIAAMVEPIGVPIYTGVSFIPCRMFVPEDQLVQARAILTGLGVPGEQLN